MENKVKAGIMGVCIGDALGVPVEFKDRDYLKRFRNKMLEYMSWNQPKGTWTIVLLRFVLQKNLQKAMIWKKSDKALYNG
jgi:ADP-ribosylglycohydrolase